jgi:hypothetical protein
MALRRFAVCTAIAIAIALTVAPTPAAHAAPADVDARCTATMPKVTYGLGIYVNACGGVWTAFGATVLVAGGGTVTGGCSALRNPIVDVLCNLGGDKALEWGIRLAKKVIKDRKLDSDRCYQVKLGVGKHALKSVRLKNCR